MLRSDKGSISIFLVIVLPIVLMGMIRIYLYFESGQKELSIEKLSYATSEAYLSKINSYLVDNFGLWAILDEGNLEQMLMHYLKENGHIRAPEDVNMEIEYMTLSEPNTFKDSILEAAKHSVTQEIVDQTLQIFEKTQSFDWIREQFQVISNLEKELSETVDMLELNDYYHQILNSDDPKTIDVFVSSAYERLGEKKKTFERRFGSANSALETMLETMNAIDFQSIEMITNKQVEWRLIAVSFEKEAERIENAFNDLLSLIDTYETLVLDESENEADIIELRFEIKEIVERLMVQQTNTSSGFIEGIRTKLIELEQAFTGIELGHLVLDFGESERFNPSEEMSNKSSLIERIMINEYLLTVFSSYDKGCPRKLTMNRRNESKRRVTGEVEFLITGKTEEVKSLGEIKRFLFSFRFVSNLVSFFNDKEKHIQTTNATMAFPHPWKAVAYTTLMTLWCSAESYSDVNQLLKGKGVDLIKTGDDWTVSFNQLMRQPLVETFSHDNNMSYDKKDWHKVYYQDYLRILMLLKSEHKINARVMDLINLEIHSLSQADYGLKNFSNGHRIILSFPSGYRFDFKNWVYR